MTMIHLGLKSEHSASDPSTRLRNEQRYRRGASPMLARRYVDP